LLIWVSCHDAAQGRENRAFIDLSGIGAQSLKDSGCLKGTHMFAQVRQAWLGLALAALISVAVCVNAQPDKATLQKIDPKKDAKTGFVIGGKNETTLIKKLTEINGLSVAELEKKMRPKALSKVGFLGTEEKLTDILAEDNAFVVDQLGLTHQELGWHLRALAAAGNNETFTYNGKKFKITITQAKFFIESPFADGTKTNTDVKLHNLDNGKKLQYSLMVPLMMERYGFYEGHDTPFRVDPQQIVEVLDFLKKTSQEYRDLFTGKDLEGWVVDGPAKDKQGQEVWTVRDGLLHCSGKPENFIRYDRQEFGDFALRVEYRFAAAPPNAKQSQKGNSGIGIRSGVYVYNPKKPLDTRPSWSAWEVQLLDDAGAKPSKSSSGSLYRYVAPTSNPVKPAPEWNTIEVECVGHHIKIIINGEKVVDADQRQIEDITSKDRPPSAVAPKDKALRGYICLQSHTGQVDFRKVQVREIARK
jgi:hypothetical protein